MGIACSHPPPPLVEIAGSRNKILIPAGTSFSVHPPPELTRRGRRSSRRVPIYHRVSSPYSSSANDYRPIGRPRERGRRPPTLSEDTESQMNFMDMSPPGGARTRGAPGPGRGYGGGGMPMGGRRPRPGSGPGPGPGMAGAYFDPGDVRARSAPDLHGGYPYAGMRTPRPRVRGMESTLARGMSPGGPGYVAGPGYGAGAGGLGGGNPYAYPQGRLGTPFQGRSQTPMQIQPQRRPSLRPPGLNEVPMGAYAAGHPAPPVRANTDPPTSKRLNRTQPTNKKVGPSGQEWIEGDPFLDAWATSTVSGASSGWRWT
ncbi:hypothetical protein BU26DRAFT_506163 [Trematosphaeria pertusa]|uniref:Uncharacterized protein n=1 Tax=Trematosphaeria pertusa TaxID=390896 RepID=A0A6A6IDE7_9PLEO|nr:uncharacterized protein BU26DRAFT_506163 [Trematosphaeria pertusa]KAF2248456.1 hypothetical protein BU26DRAFT_506163 [Trematosphaeria pertusa]